ncbi:MAG: hypothetical protein AVDCRST_MAG90-1213 [uncultured Microvirga sp.]|uniref:Uncharacterized protein n=1 Tax=uncultured Microvirga sp. TaxID=412392 RepID=A0A6J4LAX5_9HYPH|nr:MAG: hypothetical protein AVDCRST_MAG90-1213 [uncultured Microvirga sp.]
MIKISFGIVSMCDAPWAARARSRCEPAAELASGSRAGQAGFLQEHRTMSNAEAAIATCGERQRRS